MLYMQIENYVVVYILLNKMALKTPINQIIVDKQAKQIHMKCYLSLCFKEPFLFTA